MTALALPSGMAPRDAFRWGVCFAVVVAVHVAAALALISSPEETDFGVDTQAVMLDLPESLSNSVAPPTELAPGPKQEESEQTPPPKEETKPPEQESDVALPMPEPPKPEPPQEEHQATAPVASRAPPKSVVRWQGALAAHIEKFKRYPSEARARGEQGVAKVAFTIDHEGHLLSSRIVQSSGYAVLDQESLTMLVRAQPMPRPPEDVPDTQLSFIVPVRFNIR